MKIKEKILLDYDGLNKYGPINIVIFGDSVSHGAVYGYNDYERVYWNLLKQKLNAYRDYVPVNMINTAIGGQTANGMLPYLEKRVLIHEPDLVIVCFGLNDVNNPLEDYVGPLREIFDKCQKAGCDVIFMTPNMLNTYVADDAPAEFRDYAAVTADMQNSGKMDTYMAAAVALAKEMGVTVCDCYAKWKELAKTEDVTMMLANRINHPTSEMQTLFADSLYDIIIGDGVSDKASDSTMFKDA